MGPGRGNVRCTQPSVHVGSRNLSRELSLTSWSQVKSGTAFADPLREHLAMLVHRAMKRRGRANRANNRTSAAEARHGSISAGAAHRLAEQHFSNIRMALAAHPEGLMNGTLPVGAGRLLGARSALRRARTRRAALLGGTYGIWATTTVAAATGAAALSPITAADRGAPAWQEMLVTTGFVSVGILMLISTCLVLWGLRR
ncbi:hypothetical protein GGE24_007448 [Bradyrhizobium centrosematis]|nr:hypothetical protein [Bradyrhizobium centrosematis]MCS3778073.1 hypothetical protein [Bradyrhizobium centrosematis]